MSWSSNREGNRPAHRGRGRAAAVSTLAAGVLAGGLTATATAAPATTTPPATTSPTGGGAAQAYRFQTLNNHRDPTFNQLLGINDRGMIAGYFGSGTPPTVHPNKGYTLTPPYRQRDYRDENVPGSQQTQVVGINDDGTTVGFWVRADGANFGFVKRHGRFTSVTDPATTANPTFNQLLGVNNRGTAVGFYNDAAGNSHGYTYDLRSHRFTPVLVPGATSVVAAGINDAGHLTGFAVLANGTTAAFLVRGGRTVTAEFPGSTNTQALGINNADQVVGSYLDRAGKTHGFLAPAMSAARTVDDPHGIGTTVVNGLNNRGDIVGFYVDHAGNTNGFLGRRR